MAKKVPEKRRFACGIVVKQLPPVADILKCFDVDLEAGTFRYKQRSKKEENYEIWNKNWAGNEASGSGSNGYVSVRVDDFRYQAHRLIWKVHTGYDPRGVIDHINGIRDDNRICNLRDVHPTVNAMNSVNGRWSNEVARRAAAKKADRLARIETRERELLARLKAKYEEAIA